MPSGAATLPELAFASNAVIGNLGAPLRNSTAGGFTTRNADMDLNIEATPDPSMSEQPTTSNNGSRLRDPSSRSAVEINMAIDQGVDLGFIHSCSVEAQSTV